MSRQLKDYPNRIKETFSELSRRNEGVAPKTINNELILMNHAFNLAIKEWEWIKENPVSKVSREKFNNLVERWMTYVEEENLLSHSVEWLRPILIFYKYKPVFFKGNSSISRGHR